MNWLLDRSPHKFLYIRKIKNLLVRYKFYLLLIFISTLLPCIWLRGGFGSIYLDLDFARDLYEMSNIWLGQLVWQGPALMAGFNITPLYYYLFMPALWISGGNALSIVIFNILLSALTLTWIGIIGLRRKKPVILLGIISIGLSSWWMHISTYAGNGFTYAILLVAALAALWFEKSFLFSSVLMGLAIAFHPAAVFALPVLLFSVFIKKNRNIKNIIFVLLGLLVPWIPYLMFTFITKGYWLKNWFSKPSLAVNSSFNLSNNLHNVWNIVDQMGIPVALFLFIWILIGIKNRTIKFLVWYFIATISIVIFLFFSPVPIRYLYGVLSLTTFVLVIGLSEIPKGWFWLGIINLLLIVQMITHKPEYMDRSIPLMTANVQAVIDGGHINKSQKIALLTALKGKDGQTPPGAIAPQSNDYRFFMRVRGYDAIEVPQYAQADILVMFIEMPEFDWQTWSSWETEQFGPRKVIAKLRSNDTDIIVFDKQVIN